MENSKENVIVLDTLPESINTVIKENNNAIETYKSVNELDLIKLVEKTLELKIGPYAAKIFREDPIIKKLDGLSEGYKRVGIARFINSLLYKYKAISNISIIDIIKYNEITTSTMDWYRCFHEHIIPFIKKYDVFNISTLNNVKINKEG